MSLRATPVRMLQLVDRDEAVGVWKRQAAEQHGIEHAEHRGVRADAERERRDDDGGVAGSVSSSARGEAQILPQPAPPSRTRSARSLPRSMRSQYWRVKSRSPNSRSASRRASSAVHAAVS